MLLFSAEQINLVPFYYVQEVCQKNKLGVRLDKKNRYDLRSKGVLGGRAP